MTNLFMNRQKSTTEMVRRKCGKMADYISILFDIQTLRTCPKTIGVPNIIESDDKDR